MGDKDLNEQEDGFLRRWSRLKNEVREQPCEPAVPQPSTPQSSTPEPASPPVLPPAKSLTFDSDFTAFFHPKVEENVRRAALRRLFSDPHFNVMDGLDVYIDDYSKSEPIPAAMLAALTQAQRILEWSRVTDAESGEITAAGPAVDVTPGAPLPETGHDAREAGCEDTPRVGEIDDRNG